MNNRIIECKHASKIYLQGATSINVLHEVNLQITRGDRIAITGPSGSGKSTLLHLLGGLDKPTHGEVWMHGVDLAKLREQQRCRLRNRYLGFVYQFHHLLPEFSALENVAMPLLLAKIPVALAKKQALAMLDQVGLAKRVHHKPAELSGGERQRVAIGRALIRQPQCVLADEPTGNLDNTTAIKIFELMIALNKNYGTALIIVTHDSNLAARMDRQLTIQDGILS